jgi:tryptophan-rich sensory protein
MWNKVRPYVGFSAAALAVGGVSALLTGEGMKAFAALNQPPLSPPGWIFPAVWTILYVLMGVGMALVWRVTSGRERRRAVEAWALQLAVNFFWTILFFRLEARLFAFFWLVLLLVLAARMTRIFSDHRDLAAKLQIPYLVWLVFAGYLNFAVYLLNRP